MHLKLTAILLATALTLPSIVKAGGPVLTAEEPHVAEARPSSEGNFILPVVIGLVILCAFACGGDKDAPAPIKPVDPCNGC